MITIQVNDAEITALLANAVASLADTAPMMAEIAEVLLASTQERFKTKKGPDGTAWAPRSPTTLAAYERRKQKPGGQSNWGGVLHYSGQLGNNIFNRSGADFAEVASPEPYAAMMQFGGAKSKFPHLWGNIPARPFLGLSDEDRVNVVDILTEWVTDAFEP